MFTGFTEKHSIFRRTVSIIVLSAFVLNFVLHDAWAAVDVIKPPFELAEETPLTFAHLNIDTFTVPAHLGEIRYSYKGDSDKFIIHVQDAHCNAYAQHKVADIFGYLTNEYGLSILNLEGGDGEYDLGTFTAISGEAIRREVADYFLEKGEINGAEYFAINNPGKVRLWGIENTDLYLANLDVFKDSLTFKDEVEAYIDNIATALGELKAKMYSPELAEVDSVYAEYKAGEMEFKDYVDFLVEHAASEKIDIEEYPNFALLVKSMEREKFIDFKKANVERAELIDDLKKGLSRNEARELVIKTVDFKTKKISRKDFYNYLLEKAVVLGLDIRQFPQLTGYVEYVSIFESADRLKVMFEVDALERRIEEKLCSTEEELKLVNLSRALTLTRNIFNFTLTRNDYTYYLNHKKNFEARGYIGFVRKESPRYKLDPSLNPHLDKLDEYRQKVEKFFEYSFKRDDVFLENMIFEEKTGAKESAVLMTGGFHTENLCSMFEDAGISYVSILPKFTSEKGYENPYFALLAGEATGIQQMLKPVLAKASMLQIASKLNTMLGNAVWGAFNVGAFDLAVEIRAAIVEMKEEAREEGRPRRVVLMNNGQEIYSVGEGALQEVELSGVLDSLGYDGAALGDTDTIGKGIIDIAAREERIDRWGDRWGAFVYDNFEGPAREELFYTGIPVAVGMAATFVASQYAAPLYAVVLAISRLVFIARHLPRSALEESNGDKRGSFGNIISKLLVPSIISGMVLALVPASISGLGVAFLLHSFSNLVLQPVLNAVADYFGGVEEFSMAKGVIRRDRRGRRLVKRAEPVRRKRAKTSEEEKRDRQKAVKKFLTYISPERTEVENIARLSALKKHSYMQRFAPLKHKVIYKGRKTAGEKPDFLDSVAKVAGRPGESTYKLGEVLGEGGFGRVYKATDEKTGDPVAIKFMKPEGKNTSGKKIKFIQEYVKLKALKDMGVLPEAYAIGTVVSPEGETYYYMVMEQVQGNSLYADMQTRMRSGNWYSNDQAMRIIWQLVSFVEVLSRKGFVHGDLKPENIIIRYDAYGQPILRVIDMGTAFYLPKGWRNMGYTEGTYHYMSKATHNGTYSLHTDLFAIGCILYEVLNTGTLPYPSLQKDEDINEWLEVRRTSLEQGMKAYSVRHPNQYAFSDLMAMLLELEREKDGQVPLVSIPSIYRKLVQIEDQLKSEGLIGELLSSGDSAVDRKFLEGVLNDSYREAPDKQAATEIIRERICGLSDAGIEGTKIITRIKDGKEITYGFPEKIQDKRDGNSYVVESFVGEGGAAEVYKADMNGEKVALKVFSTSAEVKDGEYKNLLAFFKEYLILSGLNSDGNFVGVKGMGSYLGKDGRRYYYIAMDYADSDLNSILRDLTEEEKYDIASQLMHAGRVMQSKGLIWRDIKPENILVKTVKNARGFERKRVVVSDPGIALYLPKTDEWGRRSEGVGSTKVNTLSGTPWYMPRDQFEGNLDERTDLYAMGNVLHEIFYGPVKHISYFRMETEPWLEYREMMMKDIKEYDPSQKDEMKKVIAGMVSEEGFKDFEEAYFAFAEVIEFRQQRMVEVTMEEISEDPQQTEKDFLEIVRDDDIGELKTEEATLHDRVPKVSFKGSVIAGSVLLAVSIAVGVFGGITPGAYFLFGVGQLAVQAAISRRVGPATMTTPKRDIESRYGWFAPFVVFHENIHKTTNKMVVKIFGKVMGGVLDEALAYSITWSVVPFIAMFTLVEGSVDRVGALLKGRSGEKEYSKAKKYIIAAASMLFIAAVWLGAIRMAYPDLFRGKQPIEVSIVQEGKDHSILVDLKGRNLKMDDAKVRQAVEKALAEARKEVAAKKARGEEVDPDYEKFLDRQPGGKAIDINIVQDKKTGKYTIQVASADKGLKMDSPRVQEAIAGALKAAREEVAAKKARGEEVDPDYEKFLDRQPGGKAIDVNIVEDGKGGYKIQVASADESLKMDSPEVKAKIKAALELARKELAEKKARNNGRLSEKDQVYEKFLDRQPGGKAIDVTVVKDDTGKYTVSVAVADESLKLDDAKVQKAIKEALQRRQKYLEEEKKRGRKIDEGELDYIKKRLAPPRDIESSINFDKKGGYKIEVKVNGDALRKLPAPDEDADVNKVIIDLLKKTLEQMRGKKVDPKIPQKIKRELNDRIKVQEEQTGLVPARTEVEIARFAAFDEALEKGVIKNRFRTYFIKGFENIGKWMDLRAPAGSEVALNTDRMRERGESIYDNFIGPLLEEGVFYIGIPLLIISLPSLGIGLPGAIFISRAVFVLLHFLHKAPGNRLIIPALISFVADVVAVPWGLTWVGLLLSSAIHMAANTLVVPVVNSMFFSAGSKFRIEKGVLTNVDAFEEYFLDYNPAPEPDDSKEQSNRSLVRNGQWVKLFPRRSCSDLVRVVTRVDSEGKVKADEAPETIYTSPLLGNKIEISDEVLGEGNFGTIWKAKAVGGRLNGKDVAVKILDPEASDMAGIKFRQQYLSMRRAERRGVPGALRAYDAGYYESEGKRYYYIVEEFVPGARLDKVISQYPEVLTPDVILDIAEQTLRTLSKLHVNGILHLDIKPENIFISPDSSGRMKVTIGDFGSAFFSNTGKIRTMPGGVVGDPEYLSRRAYSSGDYDPRTDLYAVGMTLYRTLSGGIVPASMDEGASIKGMIEEEVSIYTDSIVYPMEDFVRRLVLEEFTDANDALDQLVLVREQILEAEAGEVVDIYNEEFLLSREQLGEEARDPFYVPVAMPVDGQGPRGAIHNGQMDEKSVNDIASDIELRSRKITSSEKKLVLEALNGVNERLKGLSPGAVDEEIISRIKDQMKALVEGLYGREGGADILAYSSEVGILDKENFVLATVLPNGNVALIEGVFDDAVLSRQEYLEEILFHEMLSMAYPETGASDHRARYLSGSAEEASVPGLTGVQRKLFPGRGANDNVLKDILRNYVNYQIRLSSDRAFDIAHEMSGSEESVRENLRQLKTWAQALDDPALWGGDTAYITDVHGNADGLRMMLNELLEQGVKRFVFTGDYMDRDEKSLEVVGILKDLKEGRYKVDGVPAEVDSVDLLFGNHDQLFVESMFGDSESFLFWMVNGGYSVLKETARYSEDEAFARDVDKLEKIVDEAKSIREAIFSGMSIIIRLEPVARNLPELKETAIWMFANLKLYHLSEIGALSLHGGIPLDKTGHVVSNYKGNKGQQALKALESDLNTAVEDLLTEAVYRVAGDERDLLVELDSSLGKAIEEGLPSLFEKEEYRELLGAIYDGMEKAKINSKDIVPLKALHNTDLSPIGVREGWVDMLSNKTIDRSGYADWILGQASANIIVFGHTPQRNGILNVSDKIFGIDTGLSKSMYDLGSGMVVARNGMYVNSVSGDIMFTEAILGESSLRRELSRRISFLEDVLRKIEQINLLGESPDQLTPDVVDASMEDTQIIRLNPEQGVTDWLEEYRQGRSRWLWGGLVAPVIEEIVYGALPVVLGGLTSIVFTGGIDVSLLVTSSFVFEVLSGLLFLRHHGGGLVRGSVTAPSVIALARLALLPLLAINPAIYFVSAIFLHSAVNMTLLALYRTKMERLGSIVGVAELGESFAVVDLKSGHSLREMAEDAGKITGRDVILSDGNLSQGRDGLSAAEAIASNIFLESSNPDEGRYKVRSQDIGAQELVTIDHHFEGREFAEKTATVLLIEYIESMRGRAPPEEVIAPLKNRVYITTHKDTDSLLAYLVIQRYAELQEAGIDLNFLRALAYYSDHFTVPEGLTEQDQTAIKVLADLFYSTFFVNDRSFQMIADNAPGIIKGVRESVGPDGTLSNIVLDRSIPESVRNDYYSYEMELEKDRLTLPVMESILNGDSFEDFQVISNRVKEQLGKVNYYRRQEIDNAGEYLEIGKLPENEEEYRVFAEELSKEQGLIVEQFGLFKFAAVRSKRGINNKVFLEYLDERKSKNEKFSNLKAAVNIHEMGGFREVRLRSIGSWFKLTKAYGRLNLAESKKAIAREDQAGEGLSYMPWGGGADRGAAAAVYGGVSYLTVKEIFDGLTGKSTSAIGEGVKLAQAVKKDTYEFVGAETAEKPLSIDVESLRGMLDYDSTVSEEELSAQDVQERKEMLSLWRRLLAPRVERSDTTYSINSLQGRWDIPEVIKSSSEENVTYKIVGTIDVGGEAAVVRATRTVDGEDRGEVAIKLSRSKSSSSRKMRFLQEIGVLNWSNKEKVPGVMRLRDTGSFEMSGASGDPEEYFFQVLRYYPEGTLKKDISSGREISDRELKVFLRTFGVIALLHEYGIVHADLKPSNLFVDKNQDGELENVVLGDFGVHAYSSSYNPEEDGALEIQKKRVLYTEAYRWPAEAGTYTEKTDLYAMGCILTELIRGKSVWMEIREMKESNPGKYEDLNVSLDEQIEFINSREEFARDPMLKLASMLIAGENDLVHRRRGIMTSSDLVDYLTKERLISYEELLGPGTISEYEMFSSQAGQIGGEEKVEMMSSSRGVELFYGESSYVLDGKIERGLSEEEKLEWARTIKGGNDDVRVESRELIEEVQKRADGVLKYEKVLRKVLADADVSEEEISGAMKSLGSVGTSFNWFNARVEGYEKYLLGAESALAVNVIEYLKSIENNNEGIKFLVEEYILHEALERTSLGHYEIIDITSTFFRRGAAENPGDTLLGQALRKFINENARDRFAGRVSSREETALRMELEAVAETTDEDAWVIVNIEDPGMFVSGGSALSKYEDLINSSVDLLAMNTDKEVLLKILRNMTGEKLLSWGDLSPNIKISYHGEGAHKVVLRVELFRIDGTQLNILLAAKKEKSDGDIGGREIKDLIKLDGNGVPQYGGVLTGPDERLWLIEEFIEGRTIRKVEEAGELTLNMRRQVVSILMSIALALNGSVPRDIHAENFMVKKDSDEVIMVDLGDRRLKLFGGGDLLEKNRMLFLAVVVGIYGDRTVPENNHFIFDTIAESSAFSREETVNMISLAADEIDNDGIEAIGNRFYDVGRTLFPDFGADKENVQPLVEFADILRQSFNSWLAKTGHSRGSPLDAAEEQASRAKEVISDVYAARGKAVLSDVRKNQVDIIVMPGSDMYVAQQQAIERKTARKLHKDYGQETLPFSYNYVDNWQESFLELMDERILDTLEENKDKGARALIYLPIPAEEVGKLFADGNLLGADRYRAFQEKITIIPEEDIPADGVIDNVMHIVLAKALLNYKRFESKEFGDLAKLSPESIDNIIKLLGTMVQPGTIDFGEYEGRERDLINAILAGDIAIKIKKIDFQEIIDWKEAQDEVLRSL